MFFLNIVLWAKLIQQILYDLYEWQLREYRLDRFKEMVGRTFKNPLVALVHLTILSPLSLGKLPRATFKAGALFLISLGIVGFGLALFGWVLLIISLVITPLLVFVAIKILAPLEWLARQIIYFLASQKVRRFQKKYGLKTIGITGSFGKSTTKYFLNHILSLDFKTLTTPDSINTPLGLSRVILTQLTPSHQFFIAEMGAYKRGEIALMCKITSPSIGIITSISSQHLALFGSKENLVAAKSELIQALPDDGMVLLNKNSPLSPVINKAHQKNVIYFGEEKIQPKLLEAATIPDFLKPNLEVALFLGKQLNISDIHLAQSIKNLPLPPHTMAKTRGFRGSLIIDDTFNANPEGVLAALDEIKALKYKKRVVVMRCLIELGEMGLEAHQQIGRKIKEVGALAIITTPDFISDIKKGVDSAELIELIEDPETVIERLKSVIDKNTVVFLEGKMNPWIVQFLTQKNHV